MDNGIATLRRLDDLVESEAGAVRRPGAVELLNRDLPQVAAGDGDTTLAGAECLYAGDVDAAREDGDPVPAAGAVVGKHMRPSTGSR
jgi:hypothetical protein